MYRPFHLTGYRPNEKFLQDFLPAGEKSWKADERAVKGTLQSFLLNDGTLDGEKMRSNWFPQIDADIFISHSHRDVDHAKALAGWIYNVFGLRSFIDSCVWGYANELLRAVDDTYCRSDRNQFLYDYEKRNGSTSHIHMMLATALTMMIDKTECAILLDTPNSITMNTEEAAANTKSPWMLCEIAAMEMVRRQEPRRLLKKAEDRGASLDEVIGGEGPTFLHKVSVKELTRIDVPLLVEWKRVWQRFPRPDIHALDTLYTLAPNKSASANARKVVIR